MKRVFSKWASHDFLYPSGVSEPDYLISLIDFPSCCVKPIPRPQKHSSGLILTGSLCRVIYRRGERKRLVKEEI